MMDLQDKIELTELANKLFMYTDAMQWDRLLDEVFERELYVDMKSTGGDEPSKMPAVALIEKWKAGFEGLNGIHHQAGHYVITIKRDQAKIFGYATAAHYKSDASNGTTRTFYGSYDLQAVRNPAGWRLVQFKYNMKWVDGNKELN